MLGVDELVAQLPDVPRAAEALRVVIADGLANPARRSRRLEPRGRPIRRARADLKAANFLGSAGVSTISAAIMLKVDPFTPNTPIAEPARFSGRDGELKAIIDALFQTGMKILGISR
jgi:hypothetical protein